MVRKIIKDEAINYLRKAEEFISSAQDNLTKMRPNAAGFDATQAIINANDALTIYFLEKRASKDHREAIKLHVDVIRITSDSSCRNIIRNALEVRSAVGYLGESISHSKAATLVRSAIKFVDWVKRCIK